MSKYEIWKDIKGFEGKYQISNLGNIKSLNYNKSGKEKMLKPAIMNGGYKRVCLCKNGKVKNMFVHRLVAQSFIPNPNDYSLVNHKDENPSNNHVGNLEWCTPVYNCNYGTRNKKVGESIKGNKHPQAVSVECITTGEIFSYTRLASRKYNVNQSNISECCKGFRKSAGKHPITGEKLIWKFYKGVK